jgi:hypothetical protein
MTGRPWNRAARLAGKVAFSIALAPFFVPIFAAYAVAMVILDEPDEMELLHAQLTDFPQWVIR